jgi:hypothetical protein
VARLSPLIVLSCAIACTDPSTGRDGSVQKDMSVQPSPDMLFSPSVTDVVLEVDYQPGAEPYTGGVATVSDVWQITRDNVTRAFMKHPKKLTIPSTLAQMESLADVSGSAFTVTQILAIADKHRGTPSAGAVTSYYVLFLVGKFDDGSGPSDNVLGVSLGTTGVIAMFKPVIKSTDGLVGGVGKYVEQSTLVHEFGHAIGLVNNGITPTSAHHDAAHGAHCSNDRCVMYWANEGASAATDFVKQTLVTGSTIIFAADCLADLDAVAP